ncbi:MAG TPA: haloacid dehalogenase type II [Paracoccaceae bacterium]|nr:haloacid dehalogenase type II [Paracoccaceae bacterium]
MPLTTVVFDAYGTLFDVAGAARAAAAQPGGEALAQVWPRLAEDWRRKQLEYTWQRAITGRHADFARVTADGLDWALEAAGLDDPALRTRLLALYDELPAYPEVPGVLAALRARGLTTAILSNGSPAMLAAAVASARLGSLFDAILSVEEVGVFKPDARVYAMVGARLGCRAEDVLFVSANGWDAAGAAGFGFATAWVNRARAPMDRLPHRPGHVIPDLAALPALLERP